MHQLLYGVAYYDEYMPYERLDQDVRMMLDAGINVVRIAESTWSTHEPQNGVFDFSSVDRVLQAMHAAGIAVIVGTPTYAVPTWLVKQPPDVVAAVPPQAVNATSMNTAMIQRRSMTTSLVDVIPHRRR